MTWKCWAMLGAIAIIIIGGLYINRLREQKWVALDVARVTEIEELWTASKEDKRLAGEAIARADTLQDQVDSLSEDLEESRKKVYGRKMATSLKGCRAQLADADVLIGDLEKSLALEKLSVTALRASYIYTYDRAGRLEEMWQLERKRSDGFKKIQKKETTKKVFIGIGGGLTGMLIGIGIGAVAQ